MSHHQLNIWVKAPPKTATIFLASDMNDWQTDVIEFAFDYDETDGYHKLALAGDFKELQFKLTKGSWETEEVKRNGQPMDNRVWQRQCPKDKLFIHVENWKDHIQEVTEALNHVAVSVWQEAMYMPQLNRHRRIWLYLPPDYEESERDYPVLYMHDAQNVFGEADSPYQKWEVGRTLNQLFEETNWGCIVIGIEHGEEHRLGEYSPFRNPNHGGGEGAAYLDFVVETLKPQVDAHFRTLPDAQNTLMIGSSMGGLISIYAALKHGGVFGKVAAFSPSLWWSDDIYALAASSSYNFVHKMVLLGGEKESDEMLPDLFALYNTLADNGYYEDKIHLDFYQDGTHTESFWGREFEKALRWLQSEQLPLIEAEKAVVYDAKNKKLQIQQPFIKAELLNNYGKVIAKIDRSEGNTLTIQPHWKGMYAVKCFLYDQRIEVKKVIL
jgi:predicted alpha/beta superfamily hydrolase